MTKAERLLLKYYKEVSYSGLFAAWLTPNGYLISSKGSGGGRHQVSAEKILEKLGEIDNVTKHETIHDQFSRITGCIKVTQFTPETDRYALGFEIRAPITYKQLSVLGDLYKIAGSVTYDIMDVNNGVEADGESFRDFMNDLRRFDWLKDSKKNPTKKSIAKQAEELLLKKYSNIELKNFQDATWITPSSKLVGYLGDEVILSMLEHYDFMWRILKDLGILDSDEEKNWNRFQGLGFIRFVGTEKELDIDIGSKITSTQFKKIEAIVKCSNIYDKFYFDIAMPGLNITGETYENFLKAIDKYNLVKDSRKNPTTKSIAKQAEELLYEKYGGTKLEDSHNTAWIAPSGKLLGYLADHYDSAYEVLKDLGVYADTEQKDLFNFLRLGFIRFNWTGDELDIEIRSKITNKQFKKIEAIVKYSRLYDAFYFDIFIEELRLSIESREYEEFLKVIDKYNLVKSSRKNPTTKSLTKEEEILDVVNKKNVKLTKEQKRILDSYIKKYEIPSDRNTPREWIRPDGEIVGFKGRFIHGVDHMETTNDIIKKKLKLRCRYEDTIRIFCQLTKYIRLMRSKPISEYSNTIGIEIYAPITYAQHKTINWLNKTYEDFWFDIHKYGKKIEHYRGGDYKKFLRIVREYNLIKDSRNNPQVKTAMSFRTFQRLNPRKELIKKAIDYFGITESGSAAGFILDDGRLLDFSGYKQGVGVKKTKRFFIHTDIDSIIRTKGKILTRSEMFAFFQWQTDAIKMKMGRHEVCVSIEFPQEITGYQILRVRNLVRAYEADLVFDAFARDLQPGEQMLLYETLEDPTDREINNLFQKYFEYKKDITGD